MGVKSLPKTVTRQRRDCDLNPGPPAPESITLATRLPSRPTPRVQLINASAYLPIGRYRPSKRIDNVLKTVRHRQSKKASIL